MTPITWRPISFSITGGQGQAEAEPVVDHGETAAGKLG
jgi:hypothetical protein